MNNKIVMLYCLFMAYAMISSAQQYTLLTIQEATDIALQQDPTMVLADLIVTQNDLLSQAGVPNQPTQIFFSGDEFNFDGISGVQSLNIQQTFYMPSVSKSNKNYYKAKMTRASRNKVLTQKEIIRNLEMAYYRLGIAKKEVALSKNLEVIYKDFYDRSKLAFEGGESNKAPLVSAQTLLKKAKLNTDHAAHEVEIALEIFNMWLGDEGIYDIKDLAEPKLQNGTQIETKNNPHLSIYQYDKDVLQQKVEIQKSMQLPQINSGIKLQSINGDLLYFGYQIGVNIPLARSTYSRKIEATKLGLDIVENEMKIKEREIERKVIKLGSHLEHLVDKIKFYDNELFPSMNMQIKYMEEAYQMGEGSYVEYMMSIENINDLRVERLKMLEEFYMNSIELKYWTEVN